MHANYICRTTPTSGQYNIRLSAVRIIIEKKITFEGLQLLWIAVPLIGGAKLGTENGTNNIGVVVFDNCDGITSLETLLVVSRQLQAVTSNWGCCIRAVVVVVVVFWFWQEFCVVCKLWPFIWGYGCERTLSATLVLIGPGWSQLFRGFHTAQGYTPTRL